MIDKNKILEQLNEYRRINLESYRKSNIITYIGILAAESSCDMCKSYQEKRFKLKDMPILPIKNCKREWCRCTYIPLID